MGKNVGRAKWFLVLLTLAMALVAAGSAWAENEGWLGVMLQPLSDDIIAAMDLENGATGVLVSDVVGDSPAEQAGIEKGDIIVEIDGTAITAVDQAVGTVTSRAAGDVVKIVVLRDGKKQVVTATLGKRGKIEKEMKWQEIEKDFSGGMREPRVERWFEGSKDFCGKYLKDFKDVGVCKGGRIGIRIQDMDSDLGSYFGVGENEGALIVDVINDSPAAKAGLRSGDVVVKVDGKPVCCSRPLVEIMREHEPGDMVEITFKRKGETRRLDVEVGKGPGMRERFLGEAGAPGVYLWEEDAPGGCKRLTVRVDDECCGPMGGGKCMIMDDHCCMGMMGKGMHECMQKCKMMGEKCKMMDMDQCKQKCKMMGMDMDQCMKKCQEMMGESAHECKMMMKEKCEGMMGEGPEGGEVRKVIIKTGDDDPVKCFMEQSEMKGDLKEEIKALKQEIHDLKKEIEGLKK